MLSCCLTNKNYDSVTKHLKIVKEIFIVCVKCSHSLKNLIHKAREICTLNIHTK